MPQLPATTLDLNRWRIASNSAFGKISIDTAMPETFEVELRTATVGDVSLFDMRTSPHKVARRAEDIQESDIPHCKLSLQIQGSSTMRQDGRETTLTAGDLALYVTHRPYELEYAHDQHSLVVYFPQSYLHLTPFQLETITARTVSRDQGLGRVMVPLFEQLAENIDVLEGPHAVALVQSALYMLVTVFASELDSQPGMNSDNLLFDQAQQFIAQNLGDPNLGPQSIADALFVSVRQLHARFSMQKTTVSTYIRTKRLERIREDLTNPLLKNDSISTISTRYGLHDASQVSRAFKTEFRESPSAFRTRVLKQK